MRVCCADRTPHAASSHLLTRANSDYNHTYNASRSHFPLLPFDVYCLESYFHFSLSCPHWIATRHYVRQVQVYSCHQILPRRFHLTSSPSSNFRQNMPVLSDIQHPSATGSHQITTNTRTSQSTYLLFSIAILITLAIRLQQHRRREGTSGADSTVSTRHKTSFSNAQTMQTPPCSSALPEKPFLPDSESSSYDVDHKIASRDQFKNASDSDNTTSLDSSPQLEKAQLASYDAASSQSSEQANAAPKTISIHMSQSRRAGSLIHPEPPAPTIRLKEQNMTIQTQLLHKPAQEYHFDDLQPEYLAQYVHNEILFVPSPTEYTSFEALYSKFPPPIYHEPNPTSYTSMTDSEISEADSRSYSTSTFAAPEIITPHAHGQDFPRRRSYTKTLSNGSEISGEIILSSGTGEGQAAREWRRHTKVFGGGICMACEESENRTTNVRA